jgi:hypothetical protein
VTEFQATNGRKHFEKLGSERLRSIGDVTFNYETDSTLEQISSKQTETGIRVVVVT